MDNFRSFIPFQYVMGGRYISKHSLKRGRDKNGDLIDGGSIEMLP